MPVTPTGIASDTQITHAHITTARQALPAGDSPCGVGKAYRTKKNSPQASAKPRRVVTGLRPDSAILSLKRPRNPFTPLRIGARKALPPGAMDQVCVVDLLI